MNEPSQSRMCTVVDGFDRQRVQTPLICAVHRAVYNCHPKFLAYKCDVPLSRACFLPESEYEGSRWAEPTVR